MINHKTQKRELAYIAEVTKTEAINGYDRVHLVTVLAWKCVAPVSINVGDKVIYFEVDSLLPKDDKRFDFMEKRKHRVKTIKICGTISQGLVLPICDFPEFKNAKVGDFVTDKLNVTLYEPDDGDKKLMPKSKVDAFTKAMDRHKKFFGNPVVKWMMKCSLFRKLIKKLFIHKKDKIAWPTWLPKTGAERIQNMPELFETSSIMATVGENEVSIAQHNPEKFITEEKVDGCSSSFWLDEKNTYYVGSHNVVVYSSKIKGSEKIADGNNYIKTNVWLEMSEKYSMLEKLTELKKKYKLKTIAIQGEAYGSHIQRRDYSLKHDKHDLAVFHIYFNGEILPVKRMIEICDEVKLPHVHVFEWEYVLPFSVEEVIKDVDSKKSAIDDGDIEGFVIYSQDGKKHFKCVSPSYLMKYHG